MLTAYHFLTRTMTEQFEVVPEAIHPQATLEDVDLDSLALVELLVDVQERLDLELTEEQESSLKPSSTLSEVAELLQEAPQARLAGLLVAEHGISVDRLHPKVTFGELRIAPEQAAALLRKAEIPEQPLPGADAPVLSHARNDSA